jgi:hypothetical protein
MTTVLEGYEEGDLATLRLHVVPEDGQPADGTTSVTLTLTDPTGLPVALTATPAGDDRARWRATAGPLTAGEWTGRWVVTGTGAGVQSFRILVGPGLSAVPDGRVYATTADLARWPGATLTASSAGALAEASRALDASLRGAWYATDAEGYPTETAVRTALRQAVCAQVAYWQDTGDDTGSGAAEQYTTVGIGSVQLTRERGQTGGADPLPDIDAPAALRILRRAGLLVIRPAVYG